MSTTKINKSPNHAEINAPSPESPVASPATLCAALRAGCRGELHLADLAIFGLGILFVLFMTSSLLFSRNVTGDYDWHLTMQRFEALRRTIVEFKQFPGFNPWIEGGQPLISSPNVFSIESLLSLMLGTFLGLRCSVFIYLIIGLYGTYKLAGIFWQEKFLKAIFAFYVTANTALAFHVAAGHLCFQNFWFIPWLLYYLFRIEEDKWSGLKAGLVYGIAFNANYIYIMQYGALMLIGLFTYLYFLRKSKNTILFLSWAMLFASVVATLIFYRLVILLGTILDYPRIVNSGFHFSLTTLANMFCCPFTNLVCIETKNGLALWTCELSCYLGIIGFLLAIISLFNGIKWWHVVIALLLWAVAGNDRWYYLMYWIQKIPTFSSHLCFMRIRIFIPLFLGIAATFGLRYLLIKTINYRIIYYGLVFLGIIMACEVCFVSRQIIKNSQIRCVFAGEYKFRKEFRNISRLPRPGGAPESLNFTDAAVRMNVGWLRGFGESYIPGDNIRVGYDEAGYIGEYYQENTVTKPDYWSPNRITFRNLDPSKPLTINLNPGKAWFCNGQQAFPQYKIVEPQQPFRVMPDSNGIVELTYRHPGQRLGIIGTFLFLFISAILIKANLTIKAIA